MSVLYPSRLDLILIFAAVKGARITKFKKVTAPKIKTETRPGKNTLFKTTIENGVKEELEDQEEYYEEDEV